MEWARDVYERGEFGAYNEEYIDSVGPDTIGTTYILHWRSAQ